MRLKNSSSGSAPLEMVTLITLLLLPIAPMLLVFDQVSDQIAAESIARHGLRYAFLSGELASDPSPRLAPALEELAASWGKELVGYQLRCLGCEAGGLIELVVRVGSAQAIQSAGVELP